MMLLLKLLDEVIHEQVVDILSSKVSVAGGSLVKSKAREKVRGEAARRLKETGEKRKQRTLTSKIPSWMRRRETSKVPPPRS